MKFFFVLKFINSYSNSFIILAFLSFSRILCFGGVYFHIVLFSIVFMIIILISYITYIYIILWIVI